MAQDIGADNHDGSRSRRIDGDAETVSRSRRTAGAAAATAVRQECDATRFHDILEVADLRDEGDVRSQLLSDGNFYRLEDDALFEDDHR